MGNKSIVASAFLALPFMLEVSCNFFDTNIKQGEELAAKHCQGCHSLPSADALNKKTWADYVLPKMGRLLGFRRLPTGGYFEDGKPEKMKLQDWERIVNYYITASPEELAGREDEA